MITIHKQPFGYAIPIPCTMHYMLPKGAEILDIQMQRDTFVIWYKCDTEAPIQDHIFYVAGTGQPFEPDVSCNKWRYIKTIQEYLSGLVYHFFVAT